MKLAAQLGLEGSPVLHSMNVPSSAPINSLCQKSMVLRFHSIGMNWCIAFCANTACTRGCWPTDLSVFFCKDDDNRLRQASENENFYTYLIHRLSVAVQEETQHQWKKKCLHHPAHCLAIQAYRKPCCVVVSSIGWAYATACFVMLICL